jgi:DNA modification methylase
LADEYPLTMTEPKQINSLSDLSPDERNANRGTPRGRGMVEDSLRELGAGRSVLVDRNGRLIAGNKTTEAAFAIGLDDVIVVQSDGTKVVVVQRTDLDLSQDKRARRLAIADNRTSEVGLEWELPVLLEEPDLLAGMFRDDEIAALLASLDEPQVAGAGGDEFEPEISDGPTRTQVGDLWQIGPHRLLIADSTDIAAVERLMAGEQAALMFTDPPYGVKVVGGSHDPLDPMYQSGKSLQNDDLSEADLETLLRGALGNAWAVCRAGAAWYVTAPARPLNHVFGTVLKELGVWRQTLTWVKQQFVYGRTDYHYRHEPIFYGWKEGAAHYFTDDHTQDTIWEIDRPMRSDKAHPTVKPLALVERAINNSSKRGEIVLDVFGGAGTSLIAAQRTGRVCRMVEIDPKFGDVCLSRAEAEGISPIERVG